MNLQELGSLLRQERERRSLSVRDVMDATKISRRNLNALEDGEVKLLPHPVYLKGYVRNYATLVGLDPEPLGALVDQQWDGDSNYIAQIPTSEASCEVASPLSVLSQDVAPSEAPAQHDPVQTTTPGSPASAQDHMADMPQRSAKLEDLVPTPRRLLWPWLVLLLVVLAGAGVTYQCQRSQTEAESVPPAVAPAINATDDVALDANGTDESATAENATDESPTVAKTAEIAPATNASDSLPLPSSLSAPGRVPAAATILSDSVSASAQGQPTVPAASVEVSRKVPEPNPAPAQAVEPRTQRMQELVVIAKPGEICWVEVSEGQRRKTFTIRDGDSRNFEFSKTAKVRLGNAGGVVFRVNGSHYPFEGQRGQTATVDIGSR